MTPIIFSQANERIFVPFRRAQTAALAQINRLTGRERLLVGAMALVACVLAPIKAFDMAQTAEGRLVDAQARLEAARQSAGGESAAVNRRIDHQLKAVQQWAWSVPSMTVAQVMLEQSMTVMAAQAHMAGVAITSADSVETVGPIRFVRLDISANFDWIALTAFLKAVADSHKGFILTSISVEGDPPTKVRILLDLPLNVVGEPHKR